jgi:hypothetical protein
VNTTKWLSTAAATMAHVPVVALIMLWPREPLLVSEPDFTAPDISSIPLGGGIPDWTIDEPADCEVHGIRMRTEAAPVRYGFPGPIVDPIIFGSTGPREPSRTTREKLFPHARHYSLGGCVGGGPEHALIRICTECERAEKAWRERPVDL